MGAAHIGIAKRQQNQKNEQFPLQILREGGGVAEHLAGDDLENAGANYERQNDQGAPKTNAGDRPLDPAQDYQKLFPYRSSTKCLPNSLPQSGAIAATLVHVMKVQLNGDQGGNDEQNQDGGECQPENHGNRHGDQELRLQAGFK